MIRVRLVLDEATRNQRHRHCAQNDEGGHLLVVRSIRFAVDAWLRLVGLIRARRFVANKLEHGVDQIGGRRLLTFFQFADNAHLQLVHVSVGKKIVTF
jgi:hypothetical protein